MSRSAQPLVSCIMPTANRRRFVPLAIEYFLRQDYPRRELLIIDDGDPVRDLVPKDRRVRYMPCDRRASVGSKRNLGCRAAEGDIIVHWDDDDWHAPWRLSYQVAALIEHGADICGLARLYFVDPQAGRAWQYVYPPGRRKNWVAGGTFCYRRTLWEQLPFADLNCGEDTRFIWNHQTCRVHVLQSPGFYVARVHAANTSPKFTSADRWHRCRLGRVRELLGTDWPTFVGPQPAAPACRTSAAASPARRLEPAHPAH